MEMSLRFWDRDKMLSEEERLAELMKKMSKRGWSFKKTFIWDWDEWLLKIFNKIFKKREQGRE